MRVPQRLRAALGQRFVVVALGGLHGDAARLAAAALAYSVAQATTEADVRKIKKWWRGTRERASATRGLCSSIGGVTGFKLEGGPAQGWKIETDGSDQDNRAAVATVQALSGAGATTTSAEPGGSVTLGEARNLFLAQFIQRQVAPATVQETTAALGLFVEIVGAGKPLARLTVTDVDVFRDALARWPARAKIVPEWRDLDVAEILARTRHETPEAVLSGRSRDKYLDSARKFMGWAVERGHMQRNLLSKVRVQTKAQRAVITRRGFTPDERRALFAPALRATCTKPSQWWLPVLALYTGARLRELAQMRLVDVHQVAGVWGCDINLQAGPLKNPGSQRFVPLPQVVLDAGLLDYIEEVRGRGFTRLFPCGSWMAKNGPGNAVSHWWNTRVMPAAGLHDPGLVFHSFRHTFASAGDAAGLTEAQIGALTGHQPQSVLGKHYIHAAQVAGQRAMVNEIAREIGTDVGTYAVGQFPEIWAHLAREKRRAEAVERRKKRKTRRDGNPQQASS